MAFVHTITVLNLFLLFITKTINGHSLPGTVCRVTKNQQGFCRSVEDCHSYDLDDLETSTCNSKQICCPLEHNQFKHKRSISPPDVSKHKNLKLLPRNCGYSSEGDKIVHGIAAGLLEFPWMALLSYQIQGTPILHCGGTIINERYILTAAHCITNLKNPLVGVRIGEYDTRTPIDCVDFGFNPPMKICAPPHQELKIEEIIPHPQYRPDTLLHDVGLLRVSPMNITLENAQPICMPLGGDRDRNFSGKILLVTGWGKTETSRNSSILLKAALSVIPHETCRNKYKDVLEIKENQMCAKGTKQMDSCSGDSGGPLQAPVSIDDTIRFVQYGIVSFGPVVCGEENEPGVYTKVAHYLDWILDNIRP